MFDVTFSTSWALAGLTLAAYTAYYLTVAVRRPRLISAPNSPLRQFIERTCPAIHSAYWPSFWCFHSHLLTPISNYLRMRNAPLAFRRQLLTTADGGCISIDWYSGPGEVPESSTPIALFIPGLTGTSQAEYIRLLVPIAHRLGYRPVVINYRGLADTPLLTRRLYCAANTEDLELGLQHIRRLYPSAKLIATALSMGGTVLAGYLTKPGPSSLIDAAFLISVCWDFNKGAKQLRTGYLNPLVNRLLTKLLVKAVMKHRAVFEAHYDLDSFHSFKSLRQFDHNFTIKIFGYASTDEYYRAASYSDRVGQVKVPTFCINAADDMLAPEEDLPLAQVASSPNVAMLVTARGGHIGFMENSLPWLRPPTFYLERLFEQYMGALRDVDPRELTCK